LSQKTQTLQKLKKLFQTYTRSSGREKNPNILQICALFFFASSRNRMGLLTLLASLYYIMIWVTGTDKKVWIQIITGLLFIRPSYTTESTPKPSTPKPATQTPQIPSGCAPFDAALYKAGIEGITTLAKALHNQINTKDVKFTKILSEYQRFHNSYYSLKTQGMEEYKSTKSECEARGG
jgi:hypothetical protein